MVITYQHQEEYEMTHLILGQQRQLQFLLWEKRMRQNEHLKKKGLPLKDPIILACYFLLQFLNNVNE